MQPTPQARGPKPPQRKRRVPVWDNARWIAITLVVIGHGILPLIAEDDAAYSVYLFIYSFHVAVFVTVSGYFAKSGPPNARAMRQILTDIVFPYFIFETIWTIIRFLLGGDFVLDYTTASWTLWFLIALAIWRIALPYLVLLRYPLIIAIAVSIGAGYAVEIDSTLALTRTFGMFPFFVFGWKLRQLRITDRWLDLPTAVTWRWRAGAIALFAVLSVALPMAIETWRDLRLRGSCSTTSRTRRSGTTSPGRAPSDCSCCCSPCSSPWRSSSSCRGARPGSRPSAARPCTSTCCTRSCSSRCARRPCSRAGSRGGCSRS
jgi:fucose 4-O-acetylase-like acetyltransferase